MLTRIDVPQTEEARTRGTPVTPESFMAWKIKFDKEMALKRVQEEEEKLKGLTAKEHMKYGCREMQLPDTPEGIVYHLRAW